MEHKENRHYKALELDKVLELLALQTSCDDAREMALNLQPQSNLEKANELLNETNDAHMLLARFGAPAFYALKSVNSALARAKSDGLLNMRELLDVAQVLSVIRSLVDWRNKSGSMKTSIDYLFSALTPNKYLENKIFEIIISEEEISDNASVELASIRKRIRIQSSRIREQLDKMTRSQSYQKYLQEPIVTQRNGRFVIPVKNECRSEIAGLVHDTSSSGSTVFIEPIAVVEANNEIRILEGKEQEEIERILYELSAETGAFADSIRTSYELAVKINLLFAKAKLAYAMKAGVPELNDDGIIDLKKARHPLISEATVVATDIRLGDDFDTFVITGPNTGGKTVSIKTLGLLSLMAMCGLMIPVADQSKMSVYEHVLADIGDEQSIEQSLSTFSSHMTNIIDIIKTADDKSLVLIDELGAGTDPVEGAALAISILEKLHFQGAKIAATTHYAELKEYALQTVRVENGSCEFNVETLRPTYRMLIGVPGRSNAFAISEHLGISQDIIERAKELVSTENMRFEEVVEKLEKSRQGLDEERIKAQELRAQAEKAKQEAEQKKQGIEKIREDEIEKARGEAMRIVEKARRESVALMDEIEQLRKEKGNVQDINDLARRAKSKMKQHINELDDAVNPVIEIKDDDDDYVLPRDLVVGDIVMIKDIGKTATVISLPDKRGMVEVAAGALKTRVDIKSLRLSSKTQERKENAKTRTVKTTESRADMQIDTRCDLRGKNLEEAIMDLDSFLDNAIRMGVGEVTIIHGKGTGVLRAGIQKHLKGHTAVRSFRLGVYGEGENGVTIVEMK